MSKTEQNLKIVKDYQKKIILLSQSIGLLDWDKETYMPQGGTEARAEQISLLVGLVHDYVVADELEKAVNELEKEKLKENDKIMIKRLKRLISKERKLPKEFVEELSKVTSLGNVAWREAREKSDFSIFLPHLQKIVELKRRQAKYMQMQGHLYNGLLDDFEEGMTFEKLKPIFSNLKAGLISLIKKIEKSERYKIQKRDMLDSKFDEEKVRKLCEDIVKRIGLTEKNSRLDLSAHPFSIKVGYGDSRITFAFAEKGFKPFSSSVHEAGHSLYELNFPKEFNYTVLCESPSYGIHESQSRFWENMIFLGRPFWDYYFPILTKEFKLKGNVEEWYKELNFVKPGLIRIESDEVHYCLHIILRFELEAGLIDGSIEVKDLPNIWNKKMKESFGIVPEGDKKGVLQDIHWSSGAFGYFPSYALGTIYAAQLYEAMKKNISGVENEIAKGDYSSARDWLKEKIHKHGAKYLADELMEKVVGKGLNPQDYLNYLNAKYGKIYGF